MQAAVLFHMQMVIARFTPFKRVSAFCVTDRLILSVSDNIMKKIPTEQDVFFKNTLCLTRTTVFQ